MDSQDSATFQPSNPQFEQSSQSSTPNPIPQSPKKSIKTKYLVGILIILIVAVAAYSLLAGHSGRSTATSTTAAKPTAPTTTIPRTSTSYSNASYVVESSSQGTAIINGTKLVKNFDFGGTLVYDPQNQYTYIQTSKNIAVINGTKFIGNISIRRSSVLIPTVVAYDPYNNYIYAVNSSSQGENSYIGVISGMGIISKIPIPSLGNQGIVSAVYDPINHYVYLANFTKDILVVNGTSLVGIIPQKSTLYNITLDPTNGYVYAYGSGNANCQNGGYVLYVINGTSNIDSFCTGTGAVPVYDPSSGYIYSPYSSSIRSKKLNLLVLKGSSIFANMSLGAGGWETSLLYDPYNQNLYITSGNTDKTFIVKGTSMVSTMNNTLGPVILSDPYMYLVKDFIEGDTAMTLNVVDNTTMVGTVQLPGLLFSSVYDPSNHYTYIETETSTNGTIQVMDGLSIVRTIPINISYVGELYLV